MGSGERYQQLRNLQHGKKEEGMRNIPKGCLAVLVGQGQEPKERFVVPVGYFSHPLFVQLLKEAEDEFGFEQKGNIVIPCHVEEFRHVQGVINEENGHLQILHHYINNCFRA